MDRQTDRRMDERTDGRTDGRTDEPTDQTTDHQATRLLELPRAAKNCLWFCDLIKNSWPLKTTSFFGSPTPLMSLSSGLLRRKLTNYPFYMLERITPLRC